MPGSLSAIADVMGPPHCSDPNERCPMTVLSRAFADRRTAVVIGGIALACLLRAICPSEACEIPVYQYALENWEADEYEVIVFHRGELSPAQRDEVGLLQRASIHGGGHGNLLVKTVDLATNRDAILRAGASNRPSGCPGVAYPNARRIPEPVWAGRWRRDHAWWTRRCAGRSRNWRGRVTASWVLLESGNRGRTTPPHRAGANCGGEALVLPALGAGGALM